MKPQKKTLRERYDDWAYQHIVWKYIFEYGWAILISTVSAFIFAFGFNAFLVPSRLLATSTEAEPIMRLVSGGVSGISQNIALILNLLFPSWQFNDTMMYSILYFALNIPLFILAFFGIGKRFAILTLLNVIEVSLFTNLLSTSDVGWMADFIYDVSVFVNNNGGLLSRALFAGVCTGLSSALAFKFDLSAGGMDILAYYMAAKKNVQTGKYTIFLNSSTVVIFAILDALQLGWDDYVGMTFSALFFSFLYMLVVMLVVDLIHVRNKKCEVKIVTAMTNMSDYLLANIPHGATLIKGIGAFSGEEKTIILMVISTFEVDHMVKLVQEEDPHAFIQVTTLQQVYGRFFMKPIK